MQHFPPPHLLRTVTEERISSSNPTVLWEFVNTLAMQYFGSMSSHRVDVQSGKELMQSFSFDWMGFMQSERQLCITKIILHIEYPHKVVLDLKFTSYPTKVYQS